ncbi:DUF1403 family protein [Mesorhizobium sp. M1380]|uniref:hypothetical protein n=1 Tax=Mesorhizobium sp. M1380 TaxID=2957093 RepID=UPI003338AF3D
MLTRPGDEVGPAGRMLLTGRELAAHPAEDSNGRNLAAVGKISVDARDDEAVSDLARRARQLSAAAW